MLNHVLQLIPRMCIYHTVQVSSVVANRKTLIPKNHIFQLCTQLTHWTTKQASTMSAFGGWVLHLLHPGQVASINHASLYISPTSQQPCLPHNSHRTIHTGQGPARQTLHDAQTAVQDTDPGSL